MKEIFEKHFINLVILGEKLGSYTPKYGLNCFSIETDKFSFTFTNHYISVSGFQSIGVMRYIDHNLSIDDNIRNFYFVYYEEINKSISYLKESLSSLKEAVELKEKTLKEFEEYNKMSIFL